MHIHKILFPLFLLVLGGLYCGTLAAQDPNPATLHSDRGAWPIYRQWNAAEAQHFAAWIAHIYDRKVSGTREQRLAKLERVLTDPEMNLLQNPAFIGEPSNPQVDMESIRAMHRVVDCHKLVMSLSAYYSCRRGLPFMFSHVRAVDGSDIRTASSTYPVGAVSSLDYTSMQQLFVDATVGTCTGNLRVEPFAKNAELSDTCPVAINRQYLIPGCAFYLDGHVLVLAKVEPNGNLRFLDATTAASRDLYTFNALNVVTGITPKHSENAENPYAGCFRGFRVLRYPIAETDGEGKVLRVRRRTDAEMAEFGFSTEQYEKMEELARKGKVLENDLVFGSMHQLIRYRMNTLKSVSPASLLSEYAARVKDLLNARDMQVQEAWADAQANGPIPFPDRGAGSNIYNTGGRWGQFSTALADAEFRAAYFNLLDDIDAVIQWFDVKPGYVSLDGLYHNFVWTVSDLAWALLLEKDRVFKAATFSFTDSAGNKQTLSLLELEKRLFHLSFNPNHPPELRWGISPDQLADARVVEIPTPIHGGKTLSLAESYRYEAYYRALTEREIEETPLAGMPLEGFPVRQTISDFLWAKWRGFMSPPIVPHGGRAAYEAGMRPKKKK